ncbi:hypothetical protein R9C00_10220 [Flammeovirgaceae bacterium SG7u.111]|nr:hypothetical protein [Flammeovirgaceae bacterium SG7u.132]WPO37827.1 hypothetical protein R9C00_10220 [Flammeovirgaceae bacterium SG7u.111]
MIRSVLFLLSFFFIHTTFAQAPQHSIKIHSHNDYHQQAPFFTAYQAGASSIEVDVFERDGQLFVAHDKEDIRSERTFESLYMKPLLQLLAQGEYVQHISLLVDFKTAAEPTIEALVDITAKYPTLFNDQPHGISLIVSGNRPAPERYADYPTYILFDGRTPSDKEGIGGEKVPLISRNFSDFTKWRGEGTLPEKDSLSLVEFVTKCHKLNSLVRFWNTPDLKQVHKTLMSLQVDYLNTDHPFELAQFLDTLDTEKPLPEWQEGYLDIHHISTGRGDAAFTIFPDGTTLLVDMGDMSEMHPRILSHRNSPARPNHSKTAGQWVADYIQQFHPKKKDATLDYTLLTHYHDDHFGEIDMNRRKHKAGNYLLTGITDLGSIIPISTMIDRGFSYPIDLKDAETVKKFGLDKDAYSMMGTLEEYWKFIAYQSQQNGLVHEPLKVGSETQIALQNKPENFTNFKVLSLFSNGQIMDKQGKLLSLFEEGEYPGENPLSTGIKISYGNFEYFTGGDIRGVDQNGEENEQSTEFVYAPIIGEVDVATLNHHGNRDSQCKSYVSTLKPRVWIQQSWSSDHPGDDVLRRITSTQLYPGKRDVFATAMLKANHLVIGGNVDKAYQSLSGHIVVRVYPSGSYSVFVLNDKTTTRNIVSEHRYEAK